MIVLLVFVVLSWSLAYFVTKKGRVWSYSFLLQDTSNLCRLHRASGYAITPVNDGMTTWRLLRAEAQKRDISIQELIRSVIIPDWVKANP